MSTANPPAALVPNGKPVPHAIPFPSRAATEERARIRAAADNAAWQRLQDRTATLVQAATADGFNAGHRSGYRQGWRWGLGYGAFAGALATTCVWLVATGLL